MKIDKEKLKAQGVIKEIRVEDSFDEACLFISNKFNPPLGENSDQMETYSAQYEDRNSNENQRNYANYRED